MARRTEHVGTKLAGVADGTATLSPEEQRHASSCLPCQAEVVGYKRVLKALGDMRTGVIEPAPGLLPAILDGLAQQGERVAVRSVLAGRRVAYTGGIAVAAAAGVAGVALLSNRRSRPSSGRRKAA